MTVLGGEIVNKCDENGSRKPSTNFHMLLKLVGPGPPDLFCTMKTDCTSTSHMQDIKLMDTIHIKGRDTRGESPGRLTAKCARRRGEGDRTLLKCVMAFFLGDFVKRYTVFQ